jgi:hypothetical protein
VGVWLWCHNASAVTPENIIQLGVHGVEVCKKHSRGRAWLDMQDNQKRGGGVELRVRDGTERSRAEDRGVTGQSIRNHQCLALHALVTRLSLLTAEQVGQGDGYPGDRLFWLVIGHCS